MVRHKYSEEMAVQNPAGDVLRELGWNVIYGYNDETFSAESTLGRIDDKEVVLTRELSAALRRLNPSITETELAEALAIFTAPGLATDTLLQTNEKKHALYIDGIPVTRTKPDGTKETIHVRVFDFDNPHNNTFIAVQELWVRSLTGTYHKRPDTVCFINGIPLILMEFKAHHRDVRTAYNDNYTDYQHAIAHLFYYNAFTILSNGVEAKIGTLGSEYEFFHEWKRLNENDPGDIDIETMLRGVCNTHTLLDIIENFILFDHSTEGKTVKILARNHQYLGVNKAVDVYAHKDKHAGKLGVFWHTQGSGKSYSMVFFAKKIRRKFSGSPTFVIVTDREELDTQIINTFGGCGLLGSKDTPNYEATTSGKRLVELLQGNPSFIFTLMQKFNDAAKTADPIHTNHDIILMSDEAHRTNNGVFADNMMHLLPDAHRLGFTGTPLLKYDHITARTFGGYVSVYDFKRAVEDGATVPLYYENRSDLLSIDNPDINEQLIEAVECANLDEDQREKLERDLKREYHIITAQQRLETIARDFVNHYTGVWESGKAMFICIDKITTVRMHNMVQDLWAEKIREEESLLNRLSGEEREEQERKIAWMKETEMAVVISEEQNEISHFKKWGLDIEPHRAKMKKRELDKDFKKADHPFRIVFVCAMWLTGFDVKTLSVMYFDKPMKAHSLMQAIARANRVSKGKNNGLIVDYIGVVKALRQALADYTREPTQGIDPTPPVIDKDELIEAIIAGCDHAVDFLKDCDIDTETLLTADALTSIKLAKNAANNISVNDETKKTFEIMARELFTMFKFVNRKDAGLSPYWAIRDALDAIYRQLTRRRESADTTDIMVTVQNIIDEHIAVHTTSNKDTTFDMSKINFELLHTEFEQLQHKNLLISDMRAVIKRRLARALEENPNEQRANFYERYEKIIDEYNRNQDHATIEATFIKLMELSIELDEETKRYVREGFTNEQQLAVYDMLFKNNLNKEDIAQIKRVAGELVTKIHERLATMNNWREKPETRSEIKVLIRDELLYELPDSYTDSEIETFRNKIFSYFYTLAA